MAELDPQQAAAVDAGATDVFVAAGAGSGKTRVLTARFVSAVLGDGGYDACDPRELLTVTFTEKAAGELAERIRRMLVARGDATSARALGEAWISTIHGMCSRILRQHAFAAGVDPYFQVLDQVGASELEAQALESSVNEVLASDPGVAALFDAYGFDPVASALRRVMASVRALGMRATDVVTVTPQEAAGVLRGCSPELSEMAADIVALRTTPTTQADAAVARNAADAIESALSAGLEGAPGLTNLLDGRGLRRQASVEGLNELVDGVAATIERARTAAAQLLVAEHETAFLAVLASFEQHYTRLKCARGALDFTDLEVETMRLLQTRPEVAEEYRSRFAMLMLDEFQDTNALQARIIAEMTRGNLCTVGDENQSIYGFRHADVDVFRERALLTGDHRRLDVNYRTAPGLLEEINALFGHPALLGAAYMPLRSPASDERRDDRYGGQGRFQARFIDWSSPCGADPQEVEAACIADRVCEFIDGGVKPGDIAVLMRALSGGRGSKVERALTDRGIAVYLASGGAFFECPEIIQARALLRVVENVRDDGALTAVLAGKLCGLSADSLVAVREHADLMAGTSGRSRRDVHLWDALTDPGLRLPETDARAAGRLVAAVDAVRDRRGMQPLSDTVMQPLLELEADLVLFAAGPGGPRAWSNVLKLGRIAMEYERASGGDLAGFLGYLESRETHATSEQEATLDGEFDAVRVMSIHASKGLEFPVVIVAGLTGEREVPGIAVEVIDKRPMLGMRLPMSGEMLSTMSSERVRTAARRAAEAEAVRLLYVGCTRAMESLTLVSRTHPLKDADDSLGGRVRRALGAGDAEALHDESEPAAPGARIRLLTVAAPSGAEFSSTATHVGAPCSDAGAGSVPVTAVESPIPSETAAPSPVVVPGRVSYTGLTTYERCPYRFFLTSVMRLPAPPTAQGGDALVFGSAAHAVLEGIRSAHDDPAPLIAATAKSAGLDRQAVGRLRNAVDAYLRSDVAADVFAAPRVMREAPIAVPLGETVLSGAIDVIAWYDDRALVVDYKSGTGPLTPAEAEERYRLQGQCYALAAFAAGARAVRVVFVELERDWVTAYEYTDCDLEVVQGAVRAIIERISDRGYSDHAAYDRARCETCPGLGGMCPVTRPSAGEPG